MSYIGPGKLAEVVRSHSRRSRSRQPLLTGADRKMLCAQPSCYGTLVIFYVVKPKGGEANCGSRGARTIGSLCRSLTCRWQVSQLDGVAPRRRSKRVSSYQSGLAPTADVGPPPAEADEAGARQGSQPPRAAAAWRCVKHLQRGLCKNLLPGCPPPARVDTRAVRQAGGQHTSCLLAEGQGVGQHVAVRARARGWPPSSALPHTRAAARRRARAGGDGTLAWDHWGRRWWGVRERI